MTKVIKELKKMGVDTVELADIVPSIRDKRRTSEDKAYARVFKDLRNEVYRNHYDSSIILSLSDDASLKEKKERLKTKILPFLFENKIIKKG